MESTLKARLEEVLSKFLIDIAYLEVSTLIMDIFVIHLQVSLTNTNTNTSFQ